MPISNQSNAGVVVSDCSIPPAAATRHSETKTTCNSFPLSKVAETGPVRSTIGGVSDHMHLQAKEVTTVAVRRLSEFNRRTLDALAARIYFYYSWSYECCNSLSEIRRCCIYCVFEDWMHRESPDAFLDAAT